MLSCASQKFHEVKYPPFLLVMANTLYGMTTFNKYLRGQPFTLCMGSRPQPELSHLHKTTYARFHAPSLQYIFVIQDKTGSGLPRHLRTRSPSKINAMAPDNPKLLQAQEEDPELCLIMQVDLQPGSSDCEPSAS